MSTAQSPSASSSVVISYLANRSQERNQSCEHIANVLKQSSTKDIDRISHSDVLSVTCISRTSATFCQSLSHSSFTEDNSYGDLSSQYCFVPLKNTFEKSGASHGISATVGPGLISDKNDDVGPIEVRQQVKHDSRKTLLKNEICTVLNFTNLQSLNRLVSKFLQQ